MRATTRALAALAAVAFLAHCALVRADDTDPGFLTNVIVGVIDRTKIQTIDVKLEDSAVAGGVDLPISTDHLVVDLYKLNSSRIEITPIMKAKEQTYNVSLNMEEIAMQVKLRPDTNPFKIVLDLHESNDTMHVDMETKKMPLEVRLDSAGFGMTGSMNAHRVSVDVKMKSTSESLSLHIESLAVDQPAGWTLLVIAYMVQFFMSVAAGYHYLKMRRAIRILNDIDRPVDSLAICAECGSKNVPGANYCGVCGCGAVEPRAAYAGDRVKPRGPTLLGPD